ncbi:MULTISPECIES: methyltransferase family protein [Kordiimonas]|jgi:protein-S-isoprenylcysteine O-methyltransferase Ste14|uniref:methyltransferase family protein n=1 Tax=Kordiimonas TaxID=288021 RepID=UPI0025809253|nr:hypothetical protein [Kordiimonas sp. UBA4487]
MKKTLFLVYAIVGYLIGQASLLYIFGFLIDLAVPKGISDGNQLSPLMASAIDLPLIMAFGLLHSIMARASFKRWWTQFVPSPIERPTYLLVTAGATAALVWFWQPIPITIWHVEAHWGQVAFYGAYGLAWCMMLAATFHFGHFDFFGLARAWTEFRKAPAESKKMSIRFLYALVRHPISLGWMIMPFLTPHFTLGHLVFAVGVLAYVMAATPFEEADLIDELGDEYRQYRKQVPAFLPYKKTGRPQ